jgi:hypothetical protein
LQMGQSRAREPERFSSCSAFPSPRHILTKTTLLPLRTAAATSWLLCPSGANQNAGSHLGYTPSNGQHAGNGGESVGDTT